MAVVKAEGAGSAAAGSGAGPGEQTPVNAVKLTDMFSRLGTQAAWAGEALEYLQSIRKILEDPSMPITIQMKHINEDAVAFISSAKDAVVLVRSNDITNMQQLTAGTKFYSARDAFYELLPDHKVQNFVSVNRHMFPRVGQMASYINQILVGKSNESVQKFNVSQFTDRFRINIDTDLTNVRQFIDAYSPMATSCADFGFIASVVDTNERGAQNYANPKAMFAVTGYVEFIRDDATTSFTPVVHVTDIVSVMQNSKILALALPLIADVFISRGLWRQPFTAVGKTEINLGNLIVDAKTEVPYEVKSDADFRTMFRDYIGVPLLCIDIPDGAASIPGINRINRMQDNQLLQAEIYDFLNIPGEIVSGPIGQNIFREIIGVAETAKSSVASNLIDSREITYLWAVSRLKWSPKLDVLLSRTEADPAARFDFIKDLIANVTPTHSSITTMLYGNFIATIAQALASSVQVDMPQLTSMPTINLAAMVDKSYQAGTMFGRAGGTNLNGGNWMRF